MDDKENNELNINPNPPEDNLVNPNPFIASSGTETKKEEETEKVEEASDEQASERVGEEVGETTDEQVGETAGEEVDKPAEETEKVETPVENKTEAPAFTANNLGANMASTTPFPEQGIPVAREKKPKKFLGLIIAIVAVLVLGGGAAAAYFVMHTPENLALSAMGKLLEAKDFEVVGSVETDMGSSGGKVVIDIDSKVDKNSRSAGSTTVTYSQGAISFKVGAESVLTKDYDLYLKVDGISSFGESFGSITSLLGTAGSDSVSELLSEADGTWWKITVPELIDSMDELDSVTKYSYKESYGCATKALDAMKNEFGKKYFDFYKANAFLKLEKYNGEKTWSLEGTPYKLSFDTEKLANFINIVAKDTEENELAKCFATNETEENNSNVEIEEVSAESLSTSLENLPEIIVMIKNDLFGGEFSGVYVRSVAKETESVVNNDSTYSYVTMPTSTGLDFTAEFKISRGVEEITAPENAKSIVYLSDRITELIENYSSYYTSLYGPYTTDCSTNSDSSDCLSFDADAEREDDYDDLVSTITTYITNNNGKLPPDGVLDASVYIDSTGSDPEGKPYRLRLFSISEASSYGAPAISADGTDVYIITKAVCTDDGDGVSATGKDNEREFVVYGALESGASCFSN